MKKTLLLALLCGGGLWLGSCSNDFEVAAPWKDIPVVYGLLDIGEHAHYIRLEKAFLDPDASALDLAKIADSLYYDNASVRLERVSDGQLFDLDRVDGNLEGLPREDGIFATAPNWLYKIDSSLIKLKQGETIRLRIDRGNPNLPEVTAETQVLRKLKLINPADVFSFEYNLDESIEFTAEAEAQVFDVDVVINYVEYPTGDPGSFVPKKATWTWARGLTKIDPGQQGFILNRKGLEFYDFLKNSIPENPGIHRIFTGIDVVITGGGEAIERYISVASANTGITGSQDVPTYTNLSEGRGVFSSKHTLVERDIQLNDDSRDSLKFGIHTKNLNFQ